ncbi:MAG: type II toxin-antitoxin system VapC family toxin [Rhodovibrio sp.]|nr:type II toxin-antitoxin system VapC family toxin [Rhodovibrio sp.]
MIGLDSNLILRFLTQDDFGQTERTAKFLANECSPARPGYINVVVLAEVIWTLERAYKFDKGDVATTVLGLVNADELEVQHGQTVRAACERYLQSPAARRQIGLADYLIVCLNEAAGCETTATMDRRLAEAADLTLV